MRLAYSLAIRSEAACDELLPMIRDAGFDQPDLDEIDIEEFSKNNPDDCHSPRLASTSSESTGSESA